LLYLAGNKVRSVFTIGETFYDITFREKVPISATPGGAMLNTAVSLARCGIEITLISEISTDHLGSYINDFLMSDGVNIDSIYRYAGKTSLALAFLDEMNNAEYIFYETYPNERLQIVNPVIRKGDIILFGSLMAVSEQVREKLLDILKSARDAGAIILYDPNLRESLLNNIGTIRNMVQENISLAHVVRGSHKDLEMVFKIENVDEVYERIKGYGCYCLIYTEDNRGVWLRAGGIEKDYPVPTVATVSTIGAGDSFNAGLIYGLLALDNDSFFTECINETNWNSIIETAISFAAHVCTQKESYIAKDLSYSFNRRMA